MASDQLFDTIGTTYAKERAVRDLRADLESGRWAERNSELLALDEIDLGARLLIA